MFKKGQFHRYFILHNNMTRARNWEAFLCITGINVNFLRNLFKPLLEKIEHLRSPCATKLADLQLCLQSCKPRHLWVSKTSFVFLSIFKSHVSIVDPKLWLVLHRSSIIACTAAPGKESVYKSGTLTFKVRFLHIAQRATVLTVASPWESLIVYWI